MQRNKKSMIRLQKLKKKLIKQISIVQQFVAKKKKASQVLKFVNMTHVQCDQIWQIFATLANLKIIFWPFRGLL